MGAAVPLFEAHLLNGSANAPASRHQSDVARDGQRFLLNLPVEDAAASSITVVLNWQAALGARERVGRPEEVAHPMAIPRS